MDKIPQLRRRAKPRPPALKVASIDPPNPELVSPELGPEDSQQSVPEEELPEPETPSSSSSPSGGKASFQSLMLQSTKRPRTEVRSPSTTPSGSTSAVPYSPFGKVSASRHVPFPFSRHSSGGVSLKEAPPAPKPASVPGDLPNFLKQSRTEIDDKFQLLTWAERVRAVDQKFAKVARSKKWGVSQMTDASTHKYFDRYSNVKPWNYNRVRLQVSEESCDYVNASTVTVPPLSADSTLPELKYIAMQGPTPTSFDYVWRMVAERTSSPAVIVQLTRMYEGYAEKCSQYFPTDQGEAHAMAVNESDTWNDGWKAKLTLAGSSVILDGNVEKRELLLHVDGESEPRTVWHFLYTQWPDFSVPSPSDLPNFLELMDITKNLVGPEEPRIIHCSAGVGRTGTFIALEHLRREVFTGGLKAYIDSQESEYDLIFGTVEALRKQRKLMVQSEMQYRYLYDTLRQLWHEKYGLPGRGGSATATGERPSKRQEIDDPFVSNNDTDSDGGVALGK